jgi:hypothetical protein
VGLHRTKFTFPEVTAAEIVVSASAALGTVLKAQVIVSVAATLGDATVTVAWQVLVVSEPEFKVAVPLAIVWVNAALLPAGFIYPTQDPAKKFNRPAPQVLPVALLKICQLFAPAALL